jgi:hypothetical protein
MPAESEYLPTIDSYLTKHILEYMEVTYTAIVTDILSRRPSLEPIQHRHSSKQVIYDISNSSINSYLLLRLSLFRWVSHDKLFNPA